MDEERLEEGKFEGDTLLGTEQEVSGAADVSW